MTCEEVVMAFVLAASSSGTSGHFFFCFDWSLVLATHVSLNSTDPTMTECPYMQWLKDDWLISCTDYDTYKVHPI